MKFSSLIFLAIFLIMTTSTFSQTHPPIEAGIPIELAQWRAKQYSDVRYKLNLTIEKMSPTLKGTIEISVQSKTDQIILDWRKISGKENLSTISNVTINGKTEKFEEINEHLVFKDGVKTGENIIKLDFTSPILTSGSAITRYIDKEDNSEYIYSLFVPSDASTAFPVFDQPDLKAKFSLIIDVPKDWKVVTNTDLGIQLRIDGFDKEEITNRNQNKPQKVQGRKWDFVATKPISTYVFAFAAGDFAIFNEKEGLLQQKKDYEQVLEELPNDAEELEKYLQKIAGQRNETRENSLIYVRKSQAEKFKQHSAEVFRLNREVVKYLEEYFDYKFPFPKYDLVLIPEFPFGGMEHAGATFLRESSIIFPSEPTKIDYYARANVIFHEAAHQWFGDTVTMKWFDDLWLKEGFANFMAAKAMEKIMPEMNAWKIFYERTKQSAYATDSTKGTTPIYQEIPNLNSAKSAYGNIVYSKAPAFLRQAEFYLGEDNFQTAVRSFLKKYEYSNATWQDLVSEFEKASGKNLGVWANSWVKEKGLSVIRFEDTGNNILKDKSKKELEFSQFDKFQIASDIATEDDKGNEILRPMREIKFNLLTKSQNRQTQTFKFTTPKSDWSLALFPVDKNYEYLFPNYQDYGYGIFLLDEKSRNYILANVQNEKDDFLRSMMYGSLWDSVREAELNPRNYVELVIKNIADEKDEMIVLSLLNRVGTAFNYYLDDKTKDELLPKFEKILINKMDTAETLGQRITFYRAFLNNASSETARKILKVILSGKYQIPDFKLKTKDNFDIITKLNILADKAGLHLLEDFAKNETSDEAQRYAYAAKAGIPTAENKAKYWNDFVNNKELSESWIEAAFAVWNNSRHSNLTLPYLEKALAELPNLKRDRKIFFVNGWLGSFISGQKSEEALNIVNKFLADNPQLDKDLRLKILENVDVIERAVKIRQRFNK